MAVTGKPAIPDPRTFDLRAFQDAVRNTRERIQQLEQAVLAGLSAANSSTLNSQVVNLQQQIIGLQQRLTAVEAAVGVNDETQLIADEALAVGMPVVPSGADRCRIADPTDPTAVFPVLGLVSKAGAVGQTVTIRRRGVLSVNGGAFEVGYPVYAGADGELVQHPSYGAVALPVGTAVTTSSLWVAPAPPVLLTEGFDSEHERYMGASVQLVTDALELAAQFAVLPDGLFVKVGDDLVARRLVEGPGIWIDNADGAEGNPVIRAVAADAVRTLESAAIADSAAATVGP